MQELEKFAYNVAEEVVTSMEQQERKVGILMMMVMMMVSPSDDSGGDHDCVKKYRTVGEEVRNHNGSYDSSVDDMGDIWVIFLESYNRTIEGRMKRGESKRKTRKERMMKK